MSNEYITDQGAVNVNLLSSSFVDSMMIEHVDESSMNQHSNVEITSEF